MPGCIVEVAALLKGDHNAAIRNRAQVATSLDAERRIVISGATASIVEIPADVTFEALLAQRCGDIAAPPHLVERAAAELRVVRRRYRYRTTWCRISDSRQLAYRRRRSCADQQILKSAESPALP